MNDSDQNYSRWPHRVAVVLTVVVFPLIWIGGLVTTYDAGMAVPDWPNTYQYVLFAYPWQEWLFGPWDLFVEHGHRLLGALAGLLAMALVAVSWGCDRRRWIGWAAIGILLLVIGQGLLGGFRVLWDERVLAKIHGCVGPAFFALVVGFTVCTSAWWRQARPAPEVARRPRKISFPLLMLLLVYGQIVVGALIRHVPVDSAAGPYATLILLHLGAAILIAAATLLQWWSARRRQNRDLGLRATANWLGWLAVLQLVLGAATWVVKFGWPVWFDNLALAAGFVIPEKSLLQMNVITAHVAVGALFLGFWTVYTLRWYRIFFAGEKISVTQ